MIQLLSATYPGHWDIHLISNLYDIIYSKVQTVLLVIH